MTYEESVLFFFHVFTLQIILKELLWVHSSSPCIPGCMCDNHSQVGVYCGLMDIVAYILTMSPLFAAATVVVKRQSRENT